jgi:hypothetical protein
MSYVVDTSALSTLFRNYYRRRFPSLWRRFDDLVASEDIVSTREVFAKSKMEQSKVCEIGQQRTGRCSPYRTRKKVHL